MFNLFTHPRTLTVRSAAIPQFNGQDALVPLKLSGTEALNGLFCYDLVLQTPEYVQGTGVDGREFVLSDFVGRELTCVIALEGHGQFVAGALGDAGAAHVGAGTREISGVITQARFLGEDSRHHLVGFTLRPWLYQATLNSECKVFQDLTPMQVVAAVLGKYPFVCEWRLRTTYPVRDFCVQFNESDFAFVARLLQEWGVNFHFEHSEGVHRLVLCDHNGAFVPLQKDVPGSSYHTIPFYPPGHKLDVEFVHAFSCADSITTGAVAAGDYDYTRPNATLAVAASDPRPTGWAEQEMFFWHGGAGGEQGAASLGVGGLDFAQPLAGADSGASSQANMTEDQGQDLARLRLQALRQRGAQFWGSGHVRGIAAGHSFCLSGYPRASANGEYVTLWATLLVENVGEDLQRAGSGSGLSVAALSDAQRLTGRWRVQVDFGVQASTEPVRPVGPGTRPSLAGVQTAVVCGPDADTAASEVYTDGLGRVKVQFAWDRWGVQDQRSSCWLRVSSVWAGNALGAVFTPRVGQEVWVGFFGGDPDLPMCVGQAFNADNLPPWALPAQQALSGQRSRELVRGGGNSAAGRSNQLVLDDSAGQIQVQLASDQAHSGLGWGHLTRVRSNAGREDFRGTGAEVRSDAHGALRTQQGLALSTQARPAGQGHVTDVADSAQALHQGLQQHGAMGDLALQHSAQEPKDQAKVAQALEDQHGGVTGKGALADVVKAAPKGSGTGLPKPFPELAEPHVLVSGAAGIATTARESTQQHSENHHAISSAGHVGLSAGDSVAVSARESIRLFAFKGGLRLTAFGRKLELQAVKSSLLVRAKVDIVQTTQEIEIEAKSKVLLNGAGSFRRWDGSITTGTKGRWMVYAPGYGLKPGQSMAAPALRTAKGAPKLELHYQYDDLRAVAGSAYKLTFAGGEVLQGVLDADGRAVIENPPDGTYSVEYGESTVPFKPPAALETKDWADPKQQSSLAAQWRAVNAQKNKKGGV